ncbi:hypothetical protein K435DRAFT_922360 [Dendrothele bispora CBS 962.96]|uniref:Uncharacterized protein n=1 Tax=Dendrothele bispora (strain CBS 962.96) TaxID=1314807 RepID=A0A4S8LD79_DENBC|nr:hypothetical protein K435DRAFT_922360 [Dendrothele bispora CBS 962.96]
MASLSFRARPGAVVRVAQTAAGPALRVEDSGNSTLNNHISNGSELDVHVDLNTTGLTISVIPAVSAPTEVSPQPQGVFNSMVSHWTNDHVWQSSASDSDSLLLYSEENNSTYSRSPNSCHSDILELNTLLSSLQTRSTLDSASSLDPIGLDIPSSVPGRRHPVTTRNVNNMEDCESDAGCGSSRTDPRDIHCFKREARSFPAERVIVSLLVNTPVEFMRRPMLQERQDHSVVGNLTVTQHFRGLMTDYDMKSEYMVMKPTLAPFNVAGDYSARCSRSLDSTWVGARPLVRTYFGILRRLSITNALSSINSNEPQVIEWITR